MPDPTEYSTQEEWMSACMTRADEEGLEHEQALGKCLGMWNQKKADPKFILDLNSLKAAKEDYPWDQCIQDQLDAGYSQESADKICGMIRNKYGSKRVSADELTFILGELKIDKPTAKAGRRHSDSDHKHLQQAIEEIKLAGGDHPDFHHETQPQGYTREVVELKALVDNTGVVILSGIPWGAIKAAGDMTLEVLGIPFGGPDRGKDKQGQYFSPRTKTYLENGRTIPVFYYHGYDDKGKPQGDPALIGSAKYERTDKQGHWFTVALDKAKDLAIKVWEAAKKGLAKASSGAVSHLVRLADDGEILNWVIGELSVFDTYNGKEPANAYAVALPVMKSLYQSAGFEYEVPALPDDTSEGVDQEAAKPVNAAKLFPATNPQERISEENKMTDKTIAEQVAEALAKHDAEIQAAEEAKKAEQAKIDAAVKAALEKQEAVDRRLPFKKSPYITEFAYSHKWDGLDAGDTALVISALTSAKHAKQPSIDAYKSLMLKLKDEKSETAELGRKAMIASGLDAMKANEIEYATLSSYGDEWVGVAYSNALWQAIRIATPVVAKIPAVEVPQGYESIYLPLESTDPTWFKVAEASSSATSYAGPTPTVTATLLGTGRVQLTLAKLGSRVVYTGEMEEDSLIPFASQLRNQLAVSGAEYLESAVIDGDTETTASTNINDIAGTPGSTDWFLVWDGFRKSPLITTTANSRSAAGSLDVTDYLETVKLMGTGGANGFDTSKVSFIVDVPTYYKTLALPEVLTRDVAASPTLEGGKLTGLWGYQVLVSGQMCKHGTKNLSEATGKVDEDTVTDNIYGSILAVRWDQWKFGWRRRMTMESMRWPASDSTEIVAILRAGLIQRDTEASAITYYVGV